MSDFKKYSLNPETLLYEPLKVSLKTRFLKTLIVFAMSVGLAVLYFWVYNAVLGYDLPKTAILKSRNARWTSRIEVMNRNLDICDEVLTGLQMRNDDVYRSIFGMEEIPEAVRHAGFGGENRYAYLDGIGSGSLLKTTALRLDRMTKELYVESKSFDEVATLSKRAGDMASCIPAIPPIEPKAGEYRLTSSFGYRSDPIHGRTAFHAGQDFAMKPGHPVYSTGDGKVEQVQFNFYGYGNVITIDHGFGYKTRYAHMKSINVAEGMEVKRGDCIGESGNSGKSTGPHLHYEVIYRGSPVNPMNYMDMDIPLEEYASMVDMRGSQSQAMTREPFRLKRR
jgi:hypothetical protein